MTRRMLMLLEATAMALLLAGCGFLQRDDGASIDSAGACTGSAGADLQQEGRREVLNGKIAFARVTEGAAANSDIYVVDEEGAHETRLTYTKQFEWTPVWSPDGQKLAYIRGGPSDKLYVMNADGSKQSRLPGAATSRELVPSWSPDGQKLAYTSASVGGNDIYVINMNANGTDKARLTMLNANPEDVAKLGSPVWSPNGERIAFISFTMKDTDASASDSPASVPVARLTGIYLINADGTGLCKLTRIHEEGQSVFYRPVWSPDGQRIAFYDSAAIDVINVDGSGRKELASFYSGTAGLSGDYPAWSPDGQRIAFVDNNPFVDKAPKLNVITPDGSGRKRIANTPASSSGLPTWSPDSEKIAFSCSFEAQVNAHTDVCVINADGTGWKRIATNVAPVGSYVAASWGRE